jgi:uracil-DNA glycosylase
MENKISLNIEDVKSKLTESLKPSNWHNILKTFLMSEDFTTVLKELEDTVNDGKRFTPPLKQVFRAFQECKLDDLNVVVIGQDPYPQFGVADGIAFSCGNTKTKEASLRFIHKAICDTVYNGERDPKEMNPDLAPVANQGVLFLNTSLTTEIGKIGRHFPIWEPFITFLLDMLNAQDKQFIFVLLGAKARQFEDLIDQDKHVILKASHPASASYAHLKTWDCSDIFNKINTELLNQNKLPIIW